MLIDGHAILEENAELTAEVARLQQMVLSLSVPTAQLLSLDEIDTCRQWITALVETKSNQVANKDLALAIKLYTLLNLQVPSAIITGLTYD